jgi:hypothetical protein
MNIFVQTAIVLLFSFGRSTVASFSLNPQDNIRGFPRSNPTQSSLFNGPDDGGLSLNHGLLLSSFSDGLKPNPQAQDFLMRGLVKALLIERQSTAESQVETSVLQSPCCGPNVNALDAMEKADSALKSLQEQPANWREIVESLVVDEHNPLELRFLYIPTAMYALRADSENTPGKQRQRARADGKTRRNDIVNLLEEKLGKKVSLLAVSLDFDDASVKQPEGSDDPSRFPKVCYNSYSS